MVTGKLSGVWYRHVMSKASKRTRPIGLRAAATRRTERSTASEAQTWVIRKSGSSRACGVYRTEAEAERAAREMLRIKGGAVRIQGPDGREHERFTIGRTAFAQVSAVEGIRLSDEMIQDLRDFDRKKLSDDERDRAIARKYGRKAT
jgi:hypothetical protein